LLSIYFGMHSIRAKLMKQSQKAGSIKKPDSTKNPVIPKKS
jgi:hypothetical protein